MTNCERACLPSKLRREFFCSSTDFRFRYWYRYFCIGLSLSFPFHFGRFLLSLLLPVLGLLLLLLTILLVLLLLGGGRGLALLPEVAFVSSNGLLVGVPAFAKLLKDKAIESSMQPTVELMLIIHEIVFATRKVIFLSIELRVVLTALHGCIA